MQGIPFVLFLDCMVSPHNNSSSESLSRPVQERESKGLRGKQGRLRR